jgi:hypothetical protein
MPGRLMFALAIAVVVLVGFTVVGLVAALLPVSEEVRAVVVAVGSVGFSALTLRYFNPDALDPEVLRRILNRLIALAEAAERQPPPAEQMEESDVARRGRMDRGGLARRHGKSLRLAMSGRG